MKAFLVTVNGRKVALAGIGGNGVLSVHVALLSGKSGDKLDMEVGGMHGSGDEAIWPAPEIEVGDEINIKILETDAVDEPMD